MGVLPIHPVSIEGRWLRGVALDLQTTSSTPLDYNEHGRMRFDTVRPPIAEHLFQLKNRGNVGVAGPIIETAANFLARHRGKFDSIVPVPPSHHRTVQPVILLAQGIGRALHVPVLACVTTTRAAGQLKNITDPAERRKHVEGLYRVDANQTRGRSVLLFDDLYRSGTTMNAITDLLYATGKVQVVRALTITKTRSNR